MNVFPTVTFIKINLKKNNKDGVGVDFWKFYAVTTETP